MKHDEIIRQCYYSHTNSEEHKSNLNYLYYLWSVPNSPLFGKTKMTTFERYFVDNKKTHAEEKNPYFLLRDKEELSTKVLTEFGLHPNESHIVKDTLKKTGEHKNKTYLF